MTTNSENKSYPLGDDLHSWSNFKQVSPSHLNLSLKVDFTKHILSGNVQQKLVAHEDKVDHATFDTRFLKVASVALVKDSTQQDAEWSLGKTHPALGQQLIVKFPQLKKDEEVTIRVNYSTTPEGGAIQWFEPEQTTGGKHPYMYSQCQAILARQLLPCMDTPSAKATYQLNLSVPEPLVAVGSGIPVEGEPKKEEGGFHTFTYNQPIPTPSYLIAVAAGNLSRKPLGDRTFVWTEPEKLDAAVEEFKEHTEAFLKTAEDLFDENLKYEWGIYGLLVLPSAFPYGGMENPNLTFVNSSIITGDKSLVDVVAHEICHSWSGNLATNSTWADFWLNEGFTMYLERTLLGKVIGAEDYRLFHIYLGYKELIRTVQDLTDAGDAEFTKLQPNLTGIDPDDAFSIVPYEKGCLLLFHLEEKVGGLDNMLKWLNSLYAQYKRKTFNSEEMKKSFNEFFTGKVEAAILASVQWDHWLTEPGMPKFDPSGSLANHYSEECDTVIEKWTASKDGNDFSADDLKGFKPSQIMFCLDELVSSPAMPLPEQVLDKLDQVYEFSKSPNVEISNRFLVLSLKSKSRKFLKEIDHFLSQHGRGRYVKPLYHFLNELDHDVAVKVWNKHRHRYHSVIKNAFDQKLLHPLSL